MSNARRFARTVAAELALVAADAAQAAVEQAAIMRDRLRDEVQLLADSIVVYMEGGDWKDAALSRQNAVLEAAAMMGVKVAVLADAYDCPRSWEWDIV